MGKTKVINNNKKSLGFLLRLLTLLAIVCSAAAIYEIYLLSGVENTIRYIVIGLIAFTTLCIITHTHTINKKIKAKKNNRSRKSFTTFIVIYTIILAFVAGVINYVYGTLDSFNKKEILYTSDLIVMSNNPAKDVGDITDMKIGMLSDKNSPDGYKIPKIIIKENDLDKDNDIKEYDDYTSMIVDLYSGEMDALLITDNYVSLFNSIDGYKDIQDKTKVIISKSKKYKKTETDNVSASGKSVKEPFTLLLMGIDSPAEKLEKNAVANGDTLIVVTFNPKTLNATMLSIPRDSYVPIDGWGGDRNKITHAAAYGNDCMIKTIEGFLDTKIDYYAKVNFKGLVKLVDAVGGVEVDVEKQLCTDNSDRRGRICINPGKQVLDGEHALVYARNRKQLADGDFGRGRHQQEIIMALMDKIKDINDVSQFTKIINTVSNNMDTNLSTKQMLSFYGLAKNIMSSSMSSDKANIINIQRLYLAGNGQMIYDTRMKMVLYNYVLNTESVDDVIEAMHENLEIEDHEDIKSFSFSINKPYEKKVIGEGPYTSGYEKVESQEPVQKTTATVPDFTGDTKSQAQAYANSHGMSVTFIGSGNIVIRQSISAGTSLDKVKGSITLTLGENKVNNTTTTQTQTETVPKEEPKQPENPQEPTENQNNSNQP